MCSFARPIWPIAVFLALALALTAGCGDDGATASVEPAAQVQPADPFFAVEEIEAILTLSPLGPPPADPTNRWADDPGAAAFGHGLFFDTRLSADGTVSCASCHRPDHGFADDEALSTAIGVTARHAPSVINAAYQRWFFWDGHADSLWAQAARPLEAPNEHGADRAMIARLVAGDAELRGDYEAVFGPLPDLEGVPEHARPVPGRPGDPAIRAQQAAWEAMDEEQRAAVTEVFVHVTKAIAAYERRVVSRDAPFDRYVEGLRDGDPPKLAALGEAEKRGLRLFIGKGNCVACHSGPAFSDLSFHNLGLPFNGRLAPDDDGRYSGIATVLADPFNGLGPYSDDGGEASRLKLGFLWATGESRGQFKTPGLRNVAENPPYMHGGHFATLEEVVRFYSELPGEPRMGHREDFLVPVELTEGEIDDLVAFLEALTGEIDPVLVQAP